MEQAVAAQDRRKRLTTEEIGTVEPIVQFFAREAIQTAAAPKEASAPQGAAGAKEAAAPKAAEPKIDVDDGNDPFIEPEVDVISNGDAGSGTRARPVQTASPGVAKRSA
jgi:hypothetical protein